MIDDNIRHLSTAVDSGVSLPIWFGDYPWQLSQQNVATELPVVRCRDCASVEQEVSRYYGV